jgi:hypothetical protein
MSSWPTRISGAPAGPSPDVGPNLAHPGFGPAASCPELHPDYALGPGVDAQIGPCDGCILCSLGFSPASHAHSSLYIMRTIRGRRRGWNFASNTVGSGPSRADRPSTSEATQAAGWLGAASWAAAVVNREWNRWVRPRRPRRKLPRRGLEPAGVGSSIRLGGGSVGAIAATAAAGTGVGGSKGG